jgi:DNA-directed RNA polymerase subunit RPC12/RpoP
MKKMRIAIVLATLFCLAAVSVVLAQSEELKLSLARDWGYGGFNGDIQGTFSMKVSGPATLVKVEYYIDENKIGESATAPFSLQFVTDNYPAGTHVLSAVGTTSDGKQVLSNKINSLFVSASDSNGTMLRTIGPILAVVFGAILLGAVIPLVNRKKTKELPAGTPRNYPLGGGICPKCSRPFAFTLLSLNMLAGKLVTCPYCGRYGLVHSASLDKLRAAERAELEVGKATVPEISEEEKIKKDLDDSKYQGL